ncbi:CinA family protein [Sulfuritalea hydrogenivorans]|jgi:nicotinamide-nucleotide amidase|uniref:CinA-related protein n=1 Tax=Sulfuritalea hydrogenivorans sk43H TaxID=1223802 RepID=W0SK52_9PROT|nr:nicotinamide-nucleotide amidohydrolase family protein [Sulfuritalea hydrogenivorans]MDK9716044.1 CinA family protein [Sulfuritalea sp.]BAO31236.1 CinA-related protein [Sulfuritalea hydrogenivorans sk43H]
MDADLVALSEAVGSACLQRRLLLAAAESCTGGWTAQVITHTAGSSAWFDRGFVTYSNEAKLELLGVAPETLQHFGAVSPETATAMAEGALKNSKAMISLAITGIAGPSGGSPGKPVGTVCFAWCRAGEIAESETAHFAGDREAVRRQAVVFSLRGLLARLDTA